jgi:hypothetical protein
LRQSTRKTTTRTPRRSAAGLDPIDPPPYGLIAKCAEAHHLNQASQAGEKAAVSSIPAAAAHGSGADEPAPWFHPTARYATTGQIPETVALVALGPSRYDYFEKIVPHEYQKFDEVWTVNTGLRALRSDLIWVMDDLDLFASRHPQYGEDLERSDAPIITSKAYPRFGHAAEYPIRPIVEWCGPQASVFHDNSIPYALAYAGWLGVKTLVLYGVDYSFPNLERVEAGREVAAHMVGFLRGRGMQVAITPSSTLLATSRRVHDPLFQAFYGYLRPPF